jgi:hypothetical protein
MNKNPLGQEHAQDAEYRKQQDESWNQNPPDNLMTAIIVVFAIAMTVIVVWTVIGG